MRQPLITVIVPIYKVEEYLPKCIDSVVGQTYKNLEIILVDDGSPDNCPAICDEYAGKDNRIRVIHKKNGGLSDARNAGIDAASGEYFAFVDSDDYVANDYIEYLYSLISSSGCCGSESSEISVCGMQTVDESGGTPEKGVDTEKILTPAEAFEIILYQREFDTSACDKLYKATLFSGIRFPKGKLFEDFATVYKLIGKCSTIVFGPEIKYFYYKRNDSIIQSDFSLKKMDLIDITREAAEYILKKYPCLEKAVVRRNVYSDFYLLRQMVFSKRHYPREEKAIISDIRANAKTVLFDKKAPSRDKAAIICLFFGTGFFKFAFFIFNRVLKRR